MNEAAAAGTDPFDSLRLRGLAYARFAIENPEHYLSLIHISEPTRPY